MNANARPSTDEQALDCLWRLITACQAMTDRLLSQHEKTRRACFSTAGEADPFRLPALNRSLKPD